ncbi:carboxylesterase family protein [Streptomyces sp. SID5785]|uniref:carboxylesterase/lipase family protein n=1 Tax=Streptomyces sp. SID5785 TaxID=2690309 RepID=UPI0013610842|nr:carboxylesterase family protein [Streptomyces sp. SID5785]MZD09798.1 carboxylesterase family protein [Streptomyces sp. SID5785]
MTVCTTRQGAVRGLALPDGVTAFLGIPYAAPPFGALRFDAPAAPGAWTGVRDATAPGPTAPHAPPFDILIPDDVTEGEDCLNLNVWTPEPGPGARLPVMVWLHGGAFTNGAGSVPGYDGRAFARDGVVCVTLNYRLGADGFLHLPDRPDNRGLLDQLAALRWVRDNIASFGGDPDRVTVFGESAGAMSIGALLTMDGSRGLFRRAILQSGACHHFLRPASAALITARLAQKLGVAATPEAFAAVPLKELVPAQAELRAEVNARPDPALWGEAALNMMPFEPVLPGLALPDPDCGVDLLVGSNREEYHLFLVPTRRLDVLPGTTLDRITTAYGLDPAEALPVYRAARPGATPGELLSAVATDWFYRLPAIRLAEAVPGSHLYEFGWRSPQFGGRLGACHAIELPFVFDRLDDPAYAPLLGPRPPQRLADALHAAWIAFAETGDPGWAPYDRTNRTTMDFTDEPAPVSDPRARERQLWEGVR